MVQEVSAARVLDRVSDSIEAMMTVAARDDYKGRGDRELHFRMAGMLKDSVEITDKRGMPDLSKLPWQDKLALARLTDPSEIEAFKAELAERYRREQGLSNDVSPDNNLEDTDQPV